MSWDILKVSQLRALAHQADMALLDLAVRQSAYPGTRLADAKNVVTASAYAIVGDALRRIADQVERGA
jgi:hypothetical protein